MPTQEEISNVAVVVAIRFNSSLVSINSFDVEKTQGRFVLC